MLDSEASLDISNPSKTLFVLGFYLTIVSLVSYIVKERAYISQAVLALGVGIALGPIGLDWISPARWTNHNPEIQDKLTFEITRVVLGIQVLFTGIGLPQRYLAHAWRSLSVVLLPLMIAMWLVSSLIVFLVVPDLTFAESLCIGACVTPTDPVLAASVIKGRFAEKHVPKNVVDLLAAESGANDGLGVAFMGLALFLCKRQEEGWSLTKVAEKWVLESWLFETLMSALLGIIIGYVARRTLRAAEKRSLVDHESFLAYGFGLAFFCLGAVGVIGSDDLLTCFIAGNSFTWDDWFRAETESHSFQDVIDNLLDSSIFIYLGATIPWAAMGRDDFGLPAGRLVLVVLLIIALRRLPAAWLLHYFIPELRTVKESLFFGWFGPIGVGAIYYVQTALEDLPESRDRLRTVIAPIVYAVMIGSVLIHGCSIPVALLGAAAAQGGSVVHQRTAKHELVAVDINGDPSNASLHDDDEAAQAKAGPSNDLERNKGYRDDEDDDDGEAANAGSRAYIDGDEVVIRDDQGRVSRHPLHR